MSLTITKSLSVSWHYQAAQAEGLGVDLVLSLVARDVDEGHAAGDDHKQDGDDGEDHEDDEGSLAQLYQEDDIVHVS